MSLFQNDFRLPSPQAKAILPLGLAIQKCFNFLLNSGSQVKLEEGFDLIPPELITGITTEAGTFKPEDVVAQMKELERYFDVFKDLHQS